MHVVFGFLKLCQTTSGSDTEEAIHTVKRRRRVSCSATSPFYLLSVTKQRALKNVHNVILFMLVQSKAGNMRITYDRKQAST